MATDEQRDEAIIVEAKRLVQAEPFSPFNYDRRVALHALRLQREGWEPVDEALLMAREVAAHRAMTAPFAADVRQGVHDRSPEVESALAMHAAMIAAGYSKYGREQERGA